MTCTKDILTLSVEIGDAMLRNGAEIYRVEDSLIHILESYDVENIDVYVLSNGIFASANEDKEDACSMVRHVPLGSVNLGKISALNQLTRDICNHDCSVSDAWTRLEQCKTLPTYHGLIAVLACDIGSACFCYLFGGGVLDAGIAFIIGLFEQQLLFVLQKHRVSKFLTNVFASMFVSVISIVCLLLGAPILYDKVIIGAIMPLVPGVVFTTSIRDFYNGDYLSGTIHLIDALLTALCIAVGVFLTITGFRYLGGGINL